MYIKELVEWDHHKEVDMNKLSKIVYCCHCISVETDLLSYLEIEGHFDCVPDVANKVREFVGECNECD